MPIRKRMTIEELQKMKGPRYRSQLKIRREAEKVKEQNKKEFFEYLKGEK